MEDNGKEFSQLQSLREENRRLKDDLIALHEELAVVRQSGEALSDREERHRRLADDLPAMVCEFLPDSTLTYANKAYCEYHGLTRKEILGTPFLNFIPVEEREFYRQTYMALTLEQPFNIHVQRVDHKGEVAWLEWRDRAFFNEQGEVIRFQSIGFDVTERMLAETALQESEEQYRGIFEYSPLGLFNFDNNGILTDCNNSFVQIIGSTHEKLLGLNVLALPDKKIVECTATALAGQLASYEGDYHSVTAEKVTPVRGRFFPVFSPTNEVMGGTGIIEDITARRQVEQRVQEEKRRAEAANSAKSQFLANMSHEIRTPMNGIMGFLQLLELTQIDTQQKTYIDYIKGSTDSLLAVINNILDLSKIESGKMQLEDSVFDLPAAIEASVVPFAARAHSQGLDLNMLVKSSVPKHAVGDPMRLQQALSNLVSNAVKFTRQGSVRVTASQISETDTASTIQVQVRDTGIGIAEETIAEVFKPFTQADASNTRQYGGTGLGLTIAHDVISLMGGSIDVVSTPGLGSTFTVTLPIAKSQSCPWESAVDVHPLDGKRVLVVTGSDNSQDILRDYLEGAGCGVKEVHSLQDAQQELINQNIPYHAVIIDEHIVQDREKEFVATLKAVLPTRDIPLCLLTSVFGGVHKARTAGFESYLTRPFRRQEVVDSLLGILPDQLLPHPRVSPPDGALPETSNVNDLWRLRVLVVEDQAVSRELVTQVLKQWGIQCDAVENGLEAVDICRRRQYDVVLMDCQMPVMDGYEATRQIRRMRLDSQPCIIALTAHALKQDRDKCLDAGMDDYLTKPLDFDHLLNLIEKITSSLSIHFQQIVHDLMVETELDRSTVEELVRQGMLACKEIAGNVQKALDDSDLVRAINWLQRLKSSADNICFGPLSEGAETAEALFVRGNAEKGAEVFRKIRNNIKELENNIPTK